ncbi:MAG: alpha/beta fold hydrolase [Myxococcota bacterium]
MSASRPVLFAHGLEGHPSGRKPSVLREAGLVVTAPDGRERPLIERVQGLLAALEGLDRPVLVGSSYGGLAMLAVARDCPDRFAGLVLCAPALTWNEPPAGDPEALIAPPGTVILHGVHDEIIPVEASRRLVARSPGSRLLELDDGHRLVGSLDVLAREVCALAT